MAGSAIARIKYRRALPGHGKDLSLEATFEPPNWHFPRKYSGNWKRTQTLFISRPPW